MQCISHFFFGNKNIINFLFLLSLDILAVFISNDCIVCMNDFDDHVNNTVQTYYEVLKSLTNLDSSNLKLLSKNYLTIVYDIELLLNCFTQGIYGNDYERFDILFNKNIINPI